MKNFSIKSPCTENWNEMSSTEKGANCQKCATEVLDFTDKSNDKIRSILYENSGKNLCGRFADHQFESLNSDFDAWKFNSQKSLQRAMLFSLIVVFGMTLFSCNNKQEESALKQVQQSVMGVSIQDGLVEVSSEIQLKDLVEVEGVKLELVENRIPEEKILEVDLIEQDEVSTCVVDQVSERTSEVRYITATLGMPMRTAAFDEYLEHTTIVAERGPLIELELDENGLEYPTEFDSKVYPNPAKEAVSIEIKSPEKQDQVVISLYDMSGSHVSSVYNGELDRGTHTYPLNLIDLKPGIYLVTILSPSYSATVRISKN